MIVIYLLAAAISIYAIHRDREFIVPVIVIAAIIGTGQSPAASSWTN
jgi:hypothetical protein